MEQIADIANKVAQFSPKGRSSTGTNQLTSSLSEAGTLCRTCGDMGWVQAGGRARRCPCWSERCVKAALPPKFHKAKVSDFDFKTSDLIAMWMRQPTDGLFLTGSVGTGKTHLAAAMIRMAIESGQRAKFKRAADFFSELRATYSMEGSEQEVLRSHLAPRWLVLDDIGAGNVSDHERRFTLQLLDKRLNENRPTIVSTNWNLEEIAQRMDERVASRLASFTLLAFTGADRRVA